MHYGFRLTQILHREYPSFIYEAKIGGVTEALMNLTTEGVPNPQIKASFGLTESGMVVVEDAVATGEIKRQSIADKVKDFFKDSASQSSTGASEATPGSETAQQVMGDAQSSQR